MEPTTRPIMLSPWIQTARNGVGVVWPGTPRQQCSGGWRLAAAGDFTCLEALFRILRQLTRDSCLNRRYSCSIRTAPNGARFALFLRRWALAALRQLKSVS